MLPPSTLNPVDGEKLQSQKKKLDITLQSLVLKQAELEVEINWLVGEPVFWATIRDGLQVDEEARKSPSTNGTSSNKNSAVGDFEEGLRRMSSPKRNASLSRRLWRGLKRELSNCHRDRRLRVRETQRVDSLLGECWKGPTQRFERSMQSIELGEMRKDMIQDLMWIEEITQISNRLMMPGVLLRMQDLIAANVLI